MENIAAIKKPLYKRLFTKKKILIYVIILLVAGFFIFRGKGAGTGTIQTEKVQRADLKRTVLSTGEVTSQTDLGLSFKTNGIVKNISVKVGDKVRQGQVLANLEQNDASARLTQAKGTLAQAQANYQRILDGASDEDVAVSQVALDNAKAALENTKLQQEIVVKNAYSALLNSGFVAIIGSGNISSEAPTISGTYTGQDQGQYKITLYSTGSGMRFSFSGLESGDGAVNSNAPIPFGSRGLYIQFPTGSLYTNDSWTVNIPNAKASTYITNYNAYNAAVETQRNSIITAENAVATAQAALNLKKARARPVDLQAAQAQILTAQGQVDAAQSDLENTIIRAPADGTITKLDVKVGELTSALSPVIILQDIGKLHVESNISEASIAFVKLDQSVEVTFDALGLDRKFIGKVQEIDPSSTNISGVVNYKVTVGIDNLPEVKPGMTANLNILVGEKKDVLVVPQRAIINQENKKVIRVITDSKKKTYEEKQVETGLEADGGLVEIISGVNEGAEIVTLIKK